LTQNGAAVTGTVWPASSRAGNGPLLGTLSGTVGPQGLSLAFGIADVYYGGLIVPGIREAVTPSTDLVIAGSVQASPKGSSISGTLNGVIATVNRPLSPIAECWYWSHQVEFSK
jgi:hypothetical protein